MSHEGILFSGSGLWFLGTAEGLGFYRFMPTDAGMFQGLGLTVFELAGF